MRTTAIEVWAPFAREVFWHQAGRRLPMRLSKPGWWTSERLQFDAIGDYWISVDGGQPRPDPRSQYQPFGASGPSRKIDHAEFAWSDRKFQARPLASGILYELHIGTFSTAGTFDGAIEHLDHLVELGVTHVELMPVAEFPGSYGWGYDGVCLFAPYSVYGGPNALKRLVNACHQRGLAVILDVVYNHLGPVANYLEEFGPFFSDSFRTPWGKAVNFGGPYSDEVRRFFCDNALMWLRDYHFDGLRLDAVHAIVDATAYPFLECLADEVRLLSAHLGRHFVLIAESDLNDPRLIRAREAGGLGIDAQWCDDFHHAVHTALTGESRGYYADFGGVRMLAKAFEHPYVYKGQRSIARERSHGRPAAGLCADRFVTYAQNHDQIGNRAHGERLGHLIGQRRAQIAAALVLASPYIPQLFQGEEWNTDVPFLYFADWRGEPELASAVREGRHQEFENFGWHKHELPDAIDEQTYRACQLDWASLQQPQRASMFRWYQQLIQLRQQFMDLTDSRLENTNARYDSEQQWLCVQRGSVSIVVNLGTHGCDVPMGSRSRRRVALANADVIVRECCVSLPPDCVAILIDEDRLDALPDDAKFAQSEKGCVECLH